MLALTYPATFLLRSLPMRNSARLLLRFTSSSARIGSSSRGTSRSFPYSARRTGSRRMAAAEEDRLSSSPARDSSHDSDSAVTPAAASAASVAPAPVPAGAGAGAGDGGSEGSLQRQQDGEWFRVSDSVKLALHRGDITNWFVDSTTDAIVNAANTRMLGGGGVDGAIHRKAGPELKEACREVPEVSRGVRCPVGEARVTPGFDLPASRVIHTVGPVYYEYDNPEEFLANAYRNSLKAAIKDGIKYICFPAISCGVYSYPVEEAAAVSLSAIKEASHGLSEVQNATKHLHTTSDSSSRNVRIDVVEVVSVHFVLFERETYSGYMDQATKQFAKI